MWTPTDHWLEITIETLGRREGWMCTGRAIEKYPLKTFLLCTYGIFFPPAPGAGRHLPDTSPNKDRGGNLSN